MSARDRVEESKAARERGHPATCECRGTGLIPMSGFTSGYVPCTRVTVEIPEIEALRAEIGCLREVLKTVEYRLGCAHDKIEGRGAEAVGMVLREIRAALALDQGEVEHEED